MESSSVNGLCRCCASQGAFKDIKTSYHWMGEEEVYSDMLRECFDVNLTSVDKGGICELCITQLRNASNFKKQVLQTEAQFKQHLRSKGFKETVKEEMSGFDDNDSDDNDVDNGDDEDYVPDYEIPIKTESESEEKPKKRGSKAPSTRAKKSKSSDADAAVKRFKNVKREPENSSWEITITKLKPTNAEEKTTYKIDEDLKLKMDKSCEKIHDVIIKKVKNKDKPSSEPEVVDLLKKHKVYCRKPSKPVVDQEKELNKHRHNIITIMKNSNATPFRAYHVDDGFACSFCDDIFTAAAGLKFHTITQHMQQIDSYKEKSTSIFTYVVKLDVTNLNCKICKMDAKTLEDLIVHLQSHGISFYMDINNQIVCFKFDSDALCCMYCGNEFTNFKFLLDHMNDHYRNYVCKDCDAGFINFKMLEAHAVGLDLTVGEIKCPICDEVFERYSKYKQHELIAHTGFNLTSHRCAHCNEHFKSDDSLRSHVEKSHEGNHVYKCSECKKIYETKNLLTGHIRRVHIKEEKHYKCDVCVRTFYTRQQLQSHMLIHSDTRKYQCDICAVKFKCKATLERHFYTHNLKGKHKCLLCEDSFIRISHLNHHVRQFHMNDKRTNCTACEKLLYQSQLKKHMALRHSDLKKFSCSVCSLECDSKLALVKHMTTHPNLKPEEKKYECLACGKFFDKAMYVTRHAQRVHLLEKRFVCDHCGKCFADCTTLKNHMAQHGMGPSFPCFGCARVFKTKKAMLNHARNHMEEKKVKCEICGHSFIYPYLLRDHMKQVHSKTL